VINNEELDLLEIIHKLRKKKFFLMSCALIPAIIAMIVSFLIPKKYISSTTFLAPEVATGGNIIQTPFGGFSTSGFGEDVISSQALMALLKSDEMIEDVIKQFNLAEKLNIKKKRALIDFIKKEMTSIELLSNEGVIEISVETHSPEMSKAIVEFYLSNLEKLNTKFKLTTQNPLVKIISPPYLPEKKSFPKTKINMAMAFLAGLTLGLLYIYFKEKLN